MANQIHSLTFTATPAAGLLLALANTPAAAQTPLILSAALNKSANQIIIAGQNFQPASGPPAVMLDGVSLVVAFSNAQNISAALPAELGWGTFLLEVNNGMGPDAQVSWQMTSIRQDAWANAHRIPTEVDKKTAEQGHYLQARALRPFSRGEHPGTALWAAAPASISVGEIP